LGAPLDGSVLQGLPPVFSSLIGVRFLEVANMITSSLNVLDSYARAFRDLINAKVWSSSKTIRELLRLNKDEDWDFLCVAMDVVGDASAAIRNFLQFGLDGPTRYQDVGERYLRLYGLLSAAYIQQQAILKLFKLMNVPNPKAVKVKLDGLKIRDLRHKLASHSTDYENPATQDIEPYVPVRTGVEGLHCMYSLKKGKALQSLDLEAAVEEHCRLLIGIMDAMYAKAILTLYKGQSKKLTELTERLADLRIEKDGGMVLRYSQGGKIVIHTLADRNLTTRSTRRAKKPRAG
jgi:hypothetical protein